MFGLFWVAGGRLGDGTMLSGLSAVVVYISELNFHFEHENLC